MKITTKRIRVIEMTSEEIRKFHELMERAQNGQTVNYAEARLDDGTFLGVSVNNEPSMVAKTVRPRHER